MNKNLFVVGLVVLAIAGCKSTPRVHESIPPVEVKSLETYTWESDKSLALNIAQMARPAGLGIGMEDEDNPAEASNNLRDGFDKTTDVVTGMLTSGLVGAASFLSLGSKSDDLRSWRSGLVDFIPVSEVPNLGTGDSFTFIRDYVAANIRKGLDAQYDDITWKGVFTRKKTAYAESAVIYFDSPSACYEAANVLPEGSEPMAKWGGYDVSDDVFESSKAKNIGQFCAFAFHPMITGKIKMNEEDYYIITTRAGRIGMSVYFVNRLNNTYPGFVLNNKIYDFKFSNGKAGAYWNNSVPFVSKDGERFFFDANEESSISSL